MPKVTYAEENKCEESDSEELTDDEVYLERHDRTFSAFLRDT